MKKPHTRYLKYLAAPIVGTGLLITLLGMSSYTPPEKPAPIAAGNATSLQAGNCPNRMGWREGLVDYLPATAAFPVEKPAVDCDFHEWSWEAFVWATSMINGQPRFMSLFTMDDLIPAPQKAGARKAGHHTLKLAARSAHPGLDDKTEVAGAIVEADGNMLVAPNGYPVLASVHMNASYLKTAKANMMYNDGYRNNTDATSYFEVGAAIFKATWMRYDNDSEIPQGAYTTVADVPVLKIDPITNNVVTTGTFKRAKVALLGLHVVGQTKGHPEFLWATFEHNSNSPRVTDGAFQPSPSTFYSGNFTLYQAGTTYDKVNLQNQAGSAQSLNFDVASQRFSPSTNVVLQNQTGGETFSPDGPLNIAAVNHAGQITLGGLKGNPTSTFANYGLIGTVWMNEGVYSLSNPDWEKIGQANAVGSVNLANSTAETFQQSAGVPATASGNNNCFSCHNPVPFSSAQPPVPYKMKNRLIAISHVVMAKTSYAVPNRIQVANAATCKDVNAGPLWNQQNAQATCPNVCAKQSLTWNGQWKTTQTGVMSVCGCCN